MAKNKPTRNRQSSSTLIWILLLILGAMYLHNSGVINVDLSDIQERIPVTISEPIIELVSTPEQPTIVVVTSTPQIESQSRPRNRKTPTPVPNFVQPTMEPQMSGGN